MFGLCLRLMGASKMKMDDFIGFVLLHSFGIRGVIGVHRAVAAGSARGFGIKMTNHLDGLLRKALVVEQVLKHRMQVKFLLSI